MTQAHSSSAKDKLRIGQKVCNWMHDKVKLCAVTTTDMGEEVTCSWSCIELFNMDDERFKRLFLGEGKLKACGSMGSCKCSHCTNSTPKANCVSCGVICDVWCPGPSVCDRCKGIYERIDKSIKRRDELYKSLKGTTKKVRGTQ